MDGGQRAIIYDLRGGIRDKVYGEGTHFYIPILQRPITLDVRVTPSSIPTRTGTKDLQQANITLRCLYRPIDTELPWIVKNQGEDYVQRILPSIANEVMKAVVARYDAEELITKRQMVSDNIEELLKQRAKDFKLDLVDISITHLEFGEEFTQAVEAKQVAYQESEKAKWIVKRDEQLKLANIIRAEGESESARLIAEAIKESGPGMVEIRRLEAAKEIASKMCHSKNITYLPKGANIFISPQQSR